MDNEQIRALLKKYNSGKCTEEEMLWIEKSFFEFNEQDIELSYKKLEGLKKQTYSHLPKPTTKFNGLRILISAATAAAIIAIAIYIFLPHTPNNTAASLNLAEHILAKGNVAQIKLSNGKTIQLDESKNEITINASSIAYADGTKIEIANDVLEQTISTPRGGEYQIVLSDGTKVWLNAATVLQYPTSFREQAKRSVRLVSGEAYFEVAKDKKHPFIVNTSGQTLTVLGTHFNIKAYQSEVKTTLLEGAVKINSASQSDSIRLKPGEQSLAVGNKFQKRNADIDLEMAWKNGRMKFRNATLQSMLPEVERWYNIQIEYEGKTPDIHLTGGISRKSSLATLLKLLQMSGVNFTLNERQGIKTLTIKS
ncbi:DUF4974 domain-containing protein [Pedobacter frigidisoli]|uniref:DUF4974 domain-containing protein n=1 Tax=Pedobacter frigidisoli TaxID=2530455 RepID=A0A4R0P0H3_9SPHI|nr:FecR family protein [Pedobacter frigidisoli]TCD05855.1 DUF4974 domain-containing protein [Pedobacter frigidisoli]